MGVASRKSYLYGLPNQPRFPEGTEQNSALEIADLPAPIQPNGGAEVGETQVPTAEVRILHSVKPEDVFADAVPTSEGPKSCLRTKVSQALGFLATGTNKSLHRASTYERPLPEPRRKSSSSTDDTLFGLRQDLRDHEYEIQHSSEYDYYGRLHDGEGDSLRGKISDLESKGLHTKSTAQEVREYGFMPWLGAQITSLQNRTAKHLATTEKNASVDGVEKRTHKIAWGVAAVAGLVAVGAAYAYSKGIFTPSGNSSRPVASGNVMQHMATKAQQGSKEQVAIEKLIEAGTARARAQHPEVITQSDQNRLYANIFRLAVRLKQAHR